MLDLRFVHIMHQSFVTGGGRGIALEMKMALTKVLPRQCGGHTGVIQELMTMDPYLGKYN